MVMRAFLAGRSIRIRDTAALFRRAFRYSRTFRSSASIVAKFWFDAYQRDAQLRVTGRRNPVGWIFCPMVFLEPLVADGDIDVRGRLADAIAAALGPCREALQRGTLLDVDRLHGQFVDVSSIIVLGVRDGGLETLFDDAGCLLGRERQDVERLVHLLA